MVWGAISPTRVFPLVRIEGNLDGPGYKKILASFFPRPHSSHRATVLRRPNLWPYIFMQDGAGPHRAKVVSDLIRERKVKTLPWPSLSPDLNPIENLWAYVSKRVYAPGKSYSNPDQLWEAVQDVWNNIPVSVLQDLYASMPRRLDLCIKAHGWPTKY